MMTGIAFILVAVSILMFFAGLIWVIISAIDGVDEGFDTGRMSRSNFFSLIIRGARKLWNTFVSAATWKPETQIDKEIKETKKEIQKFEIHKEKMAELERLKEREKELFKDVVENEINEDIDTFDCYDCNKRFIGLNNFYKHMRKEH